jgi:error-prone DNA polymerase
MYAELHVTSNFSFLEGASHPEELVARAGELGLAALALTDRNSLAGVVRAHVAAKRMNGSAGVRFIVGARLDFTDGPSLLCYPKDRAAYGRLSRLLTLGRRAAPKGQCHLRTEDLWAHAEGQVLIALPPDGPPDGIADAADGATFRTWLEHLKSRLPDLYLAAHCLYRGDDALRLAQLAGLAQACDTPLVAVNDVHYHAAERRPLQDVLTCIRLGVTIREAGTRLYAHAERHLKSPAAMAEQFRHYPDALARTLEIMQACQFSLAELRYEYPAEPADNDASPQAVLTRLAWEGAGARYPKGVPEKVRGLIVRELGLIETLGYAPYFLTVHDIVRFASGRGILCQGRGSAANSAVCYCLGITAVDPARIELLFERFVSAERREPPDIDVDFEHERREEVIQYIYAKYGRDRAGLAATVIHYRPRSAMRDVAKAMGLPLDLADRLARGVWGWDDADSATSNRFVRELGLDPAAPDLALTLRLARKLVGFPRHLSQHVGGFVITRGPLCEVMPIENAAMADRTVVQWDKDDLAALGILKIDVLALGMLSCVAKGFDLIRRHHRRAFGLASVPAEDPLVYDMLCRGDSLGVFQVESRAQMAMLPRLKPRTFYDLVIEVALVRPGPIQGDMVHPYLRRRDGIEAVDYPSVELAEVLKRTLGVPLFQEQAMRIAMVAAGFSGAEADGLRRAMATFRRLGTIHAFRNKFIDGMTARGYAPDFAQRCFRQIEGFGDYGFPESHAASFALLVYVSAWMKRHYPAAFACALLNSQPMGFYAPAQIVRDARDHGVEVRAVDVNFSAYDCTLEDEPVALRLGLREIKGLQKAIALQLVAARGHGYASLIDLQSHAGLSLAALETLSEADAFGSLGLKRRDALWRTLGLRVGGKGDLKGGAQAALPLFAAADRNARHHNRPPVDAEPVEAAEAVLPAASLGEEVIADYRLLRLSLKAHPVALLRAEFAQAGLIPASALSELPDGAPVKVAGLVLVRQKPGTASGVIFVTLEDESGVVNVIIWPKIFDRDRRAVLAARLMRVEGRLQRQGSVMHVIAARVTDWSRHLHTLKFQGKPPPIAQSATSRTVIPPSRNFK